uniref:Cationic amino acid transporter C-terminal domain-containing protein n=1 Tax=Strigamia maritima TaxID=126957 RepID=T1IVD3_STRMM
MEAMAAIINDSTTPGPANLCATIPATKYIPVPTQLPTPRDVRSKHKKINSESSAWEVVFPARHHFLILAVSGLIDEGIGLDHRWIGGLGQRVATVDFVCPRNKEMDLVDHLPPMMNVIAILILYCGLKDVEVVSVIHDWPLMTRDADQTRRWRAPRKGFRRPHNSNGWEKLRKRIEIQCLRQFSCISNFCLCEYKFISQSRSSLIHTCYEINGELSSFLIGWSLLLYEMSAVALSAKTISSAVNYTKHRKNEKIFKVAILFLTIVVIIFFLIVGAMNSDFENILFGDWEIIGVKVLRNTSFCSSIFCTSFLLNSHRDCQWKSKLVLPIISLLHIVITVIICLCLIFMLQLMIHGRLMLSATILFEVFQVQNVAWASYIMLASIPVCLGMAILVISQSVCTTVRDMASEGLLFLFLNDCSTSKLKWRSCLSVALLGSLVVLLIPTHKLVNSMATGYLAISAIVLLCALHQRYLKTDDKWHYQPMRTEVSNNPTEKRCSNEITEYLNNNGNIEGSQIISDGEDSSDTDVDAIVEEYKENLDVATVTTLNEEIIIQEPTLKTGNRVTVCIILLCLVILPLETLFTSDFWYLRLVGCVLILFGFVLSVMINRQPQVLFDKAKFRVPFFPFTPNIALCLHLVLLMNIMRTNWIWITTWMISGLTIYFGYGIKHSSAHKLSNTIDVTPEEIQLRKKSKTLKSNSVHNHIDDEDCMYQK